MIREHRRCWGRAQVLVGHAGHTPRGITGEYLEWVERQELGADTSVAAYVAARDREYRAAAPERLRASLAANEPALDLEALQAILAGAP